MLSFGGKGAVVGFGGVLRNLMPTVAVDIVEAGRSVLWTVGDDDRDCEDVGV